MIRSYTYIFIILLSAFISCTSSKKDNDVEKLKSDLSSKVDSLRQTVPYNTFIGTVTDISYSDDIINITIYPNDLFSSYNDADNQGIICNLLSTEFIKSTHSINKDILSKSNTSFVYTFVNLKHPSYSNKKQTINLKSIANNINNDTNVLSPSFYKRLLIKNNTTLPKKVNDNILLMSIDTLSNNIIFNCKLANINISNVTSEVKAISRDKALTVCNSWAEDMPEIFSDLAKYNFIFLFRIRKANGDELFSIKLPVKEVVNSK